MLNKYLGFILRRIPENNRLERIWKLAQVDFRKRYYNDRFGLIWALINPLSQIFVYFFFFTKVFNVREEDFALFLFGGLIVWMFFTETSNKGMTLVSTKKYLLQNIQFNQLDLFYSLSLSVLFGFIFNLAAYLILCLIMNNSLPLEILYLPLLIIPVVIISTAVAILVSTIKIFFNDIAHLWSIIILIGFWSSGIFFNVNRLPESYALLLKILQPFVGIVYNFRAITIGNQEWSFFLLMISYIWAVLLFGLAVVVFRKNFHYAVEKL